PTPCRGRPRAWVADLGHDDAAFSEPRAARRLRRPAAGLGVVVARAAARMADALAGAAGRRSAYLLPPLAGCRARRLRVALLPCRRRLRRGGRRVEGLRPL